MRWLYIVICIAGINACSGQQWLEQTPAAPPCGDLLPGDLVFSEVLADAEGPDAEAEFVELFWARATGTVVDGLWFEQSWDGGRRSQRMLLDALDTDPYAFHMLWFSSPDTDRSHAYTAGLRNEALVVAVGCDDLVLDQAWVEADAGMVWSFDGNGMPDAILNDDPRRWCAHEQGMVTPAARNQPCGAPLDRGQPLCIGVDDLERAANPVSAGDISIVEIHADPAAAPDADGEWLELLLHNTCDLNGLEVLVNDTLRYRVEEHSCQTLQAGDRFLLVASGDARTNGGIDAWQAVADLGLSNGGGTVALVSGGITVDQARWQEAPAGVAWQFDGQRWCAATSEYGAGDRGSPGSANEMCPDAGLQPKPGEVVLAEFLADPEGTESTTTEWIELRNIGTRAVDLRGCQLLDDGSDSHEIATALPLASGGRVVLAEAALPGAVQDYQYSRFTLSNSSDEIVLQCNATEIVRYSYVAGFVAEGVAWARDPERLSVWCPATTTTPAGNLGSPGEPNAACP